MQADRSSSSNSSGGTGAFSPQHRNLAVELSPLAAGNSSLQFDRSNSYGADGQSSFTSRDCRGSSSSSSSSDIDADDSTPHSGWADATGAFEPFAVEEQATEVSYLKKSLAKKVC